MEGHAGASIHSTGHGGPQPAAGSDALNEAANCGEPIQEQGLHAVVVCS